MGRQSTLRTIIEQYVFARQRKFVFYHPLLSDRRSDVPLNPGFAYRLATVADVSSFGGFRTMYQPAQFEEWIRNGDHVFLAIKDGTPVAFQVISKQSRTRMPYAAFPLESGQVWVVDIYTLPAFRSHHVAYSLRQFREETLSKMGYTETVATIRERNLPSLRVVGHSTFRSIRYYRYLRILWYESMWIESDARERFTSLLARITTDPQHPSHSAIRH